MYLVLQNYSCSLNIRSYSLSICQISAASYLSSLLEFGKPWKELSACRLNKNKIKLEKTRKKCFVLKNWEMEN